MTAEIESPMSFPRPIPIENGSIDSTRMKLEAET